MVDCLRGKSVDDIMRVDLKTPQYLTAFGPIIDGIVVPSEPRQLMQSKTSDGSQSFPMNSMANINNVDLMFGVTRVESPFIFSGIEERHGIDLSRRERILRTLVRNLYDYHQQVCQIWHPNKSWLAFITQYSLYSGLVSLNACPMPERIQWFIFSQQMFRLFRDQTNENFIFTRVLQRVKVRGHDFGLITNEGLFSIDLKILKCICKVDETFSISITLQCLSAINSGLALHLFPFTQLSFGRHVLTFYLQLLTRIFHLEELKFNNNNKNVIDGEECSRHLY